MADGFTWYLDEQFRYRTLMGPHDGVIRVAKGFETDFASIPSPLTIVLPKWSVYGPAAVVHDWLYWVQNGDREDADSVFLEAMNVLGVEAWKRKILYLAVRIFGGVAWRGNRKLRAQGVTRMRPTGSAWPAFPTWHRRRFSVASWILRRPGSIVPTEIRKESQRRPG